MAPLSKGAPLLLPDHVPHMVIMGLSQHDVPRRTRCAMLNTLCCAAGRGVDQILPHHCHPRIYESCVQDARVYTQLAIETNGPLPEERGFAYPWGFALRDMDARLPDVRLINLETAVTTHGRPWPGKGIQYRMHPGEAGFCSTPMSGEHLRKRGLW